MRCLFTMFAEDVGLLPEKGFEKLLGEMVDTPQHFAPALENLWRAMDEGNYSPYLNATLKRFNGALFRKRKAIALEKDDISELHIAAGRDWRDVEPAIFGTLLERALDKRERSKLGAHYTPRAYVERLVVPTIVEPLRADWEEALTRAHALEGEGKHQAALQTIKDFHHRLCTTRVLDPACGTGNFLYVSLELMKRLEGEVLDALDDLGENPRLAMEGETVSPRQFHGLEINPRAVAIADLVLWIGYLKWQLRTVKAERHRRAGAPRLRHHQGAGRDPGLGQAGTAARRARRAALPLGRRDHEAPPDHRRGGPRSRRHAGSSTATRTRARPRGPRPSSSSAIRPSSAARTCARSWATATPRRRGRHDPKIPGGADFVMHFWDEAATRLLRKPTKGKTNPLRRFGFITTNSVTQTFSRRVIERHARGEGAAVPGLRRSRPPLAEGGRQGGGPDRHDSRRAR